MAMPSRSCSLLLFATLLTWAAFAWAGQAPASGDFLRLDARATDRLIVRMRSSTLVTRQLHQRLHQLAGVPLTPHHVMGNGAQVFQLGAHTPLVHVQAIARRIAQDPNVLYAEPDIRMHANAMTPNDPMFQQQSDLYDPVGGINVQPAWAITTGSPNIIVADIDSGARFDHEDLRGRLIAGYDFVRKNMNPTDPGTLIDGNILWHGSHTAGTIGAATNNGRGIAGINWVSKVLVIRVLDPNNFAYTSTVADAIRWAVGLPVPGTPQNQTPAQVINLSAGGSGACENAYIDAINAALARNVALITSAGNDGQDASGQEPANCPGAITVAAIDPNGSRASYSNYGALVSIAAPGTNTWSVGAVGNMTPSSYEQMIGTSMAAPHVTGVVSLMLSVNPRLSPATIRTILQRTARRFPPGANCSGICQAGILDAGAAVRMAAGVRAGNPAAPPAAASGLRALAGGAQTAHPGARVMLMGGAQLRSPARVTAWLWQQTSGAAVRLSNPRAPRPVFIAPQASGRLVFRLTVRDSTGQVASAATHVTVGG